MQKEMNIRQVNYQNQRRINIATYQQWSQSYFDDLTLKEHIINNEWFKSMLTMLKDDGILYVPILDKEFNKLGEEVTQ